MRHRSDAHDGEQGECWPFVEDRSPTANTATLTHWKGPGGCTSKCRVYVRTKRKTSGTTSASSRSVRCGMERTGRTRTCVGRDPEIEPTSSLHAELNVARRGIFLRPQALATDCSGNAAQLLAAYAAPVTAARRSRTQLTHRNTPKGSPSKRSDRHSCPHLRFMTGSCSSVERPATIGG